ncbi:hypothetical protein O181_021956 [Austropuccinia psidii MF-1]|uniref:Uncharacterized protein n=1 Tax=Austropuccinia psidii MF-1 TaxID=1389203 RepID=A0A9Q3CGG7_9BASI|nr:hypothetical protein [Austropuccinia psidii MF-1]
MVPQIYKFHHPNGKPKIAIQISPIHNYFAKDPTSPSKVFQFICYLMKLVIGQQLPQLTIISTNKISNPMAFRALDSEAFGLQDNLIAMVPFDHLGYLAINETSSALLFLHD